MRCVPLQPCLASCSPTCSTYYPHCQAKADLIGARHDDFSPKSQEVLPSDLGSVLNRLLSFPFNRLAEQREKESEEWASPVSGLIFKETRASCVGVLFVVLKEVEGDSWFTRWAEKQPRAFSLCKGPSFNLLRRPGGSTQVAQSSTRETHRFFPKRTWTRGVAIGRKLSR